MPQNLVALGTTCCAPTGCDETHPDYVPLTKGDFKGGYPFERAMKHSPIITRGAAAPWSPVASPGDCKPPPAQSLKPAPALTHTIVPTPHVPDRRRSMNSNYLHSPKPRKKLSRATKAAPGPAWNTILTRRSATVPRTV